MKNVLIYAAGYTIVFTWLIMLVLGNLGVGGMSFLACLPAGFLLEEVAQINIGRS